jgi:plasmid stability protein
LEEGELAMTAATAFGNTSKETTHAPSASIDSTWLAGGTMATLTIRNVDIVVRNKIKIEAAKNGRSMEAEVRALLAERYLPGVLGKDLLAFCDNMRKEFGGLDLELPPRDSYQQIPDFIQPYLDKEADGSNQ